jgi:geranylgeranyl reductase family protein
MAPLRQEKTTVTLVGKGDPMTTGRFDALIVGAGPAGSIAALVLARAGARVALVDKSTFPRDKACGDLIGPRGVQLLDDLALEFPDAARVADMIVVGPHGDRVRLPAAPGRTYPGHAIVVQRSRFDATLQQAAVAAGAEYYDGRAGEPLLTGDRLHGFVLSSSTRLRADAIVGADGATSHVADVAGLVEPGRLLWGFAARTYLDEPVDLPHIMFWTPTRGRAFPGYGWTFPTGDGRVNVGLGVGVLADRSAGRRATRDLHDFLEHASRVGVLDARVPRRSPERPLGAWLKMGLVGTTPARGRVLLVGDAAGLVNPLQGEGIAQAMDSGRAAAHAILGGADRAAHRYCAHLARRHLPYLSTTAFVHRSLLRHPRFTAALTRGLTAPGVGNSLAGAWSIAWNDLVDGAAPSRAATVAAAVAGLGRIASAGSSDRRWIENHCSRRVRTDVVG